MVWLEYSITAQYFLTQSLEIWITWNVQNLPNTTIPNIHQYLSKLGRKSIWMEENKILKVFVSEHQIFGHFHSFSWPNSTHFFCSIVHSPSYILEVCVMNDKPYKRRNEQKLYPLPGIFLNVCRIFLCSCSQISLFLHEICHKSRKVYAKDTKKIFVD